MQPSISSLGFLRDPSCMGTAEKEGTIHLRVPVSRCVGWWSRFGTDLQQQWAVKEPSSHRSIQHALLIEKQREQRLTTPIQ